MASILTQNDSEVVVPAPARGGVDDKRASNNRAKDADGDVHSIDEGVDDKTMSDRHQLSSHIGEGYLGGCSQTDESCSTDQLLNRLRCRSNDASDQAEGCTSNKEVSPSEDIRKTSDESISQRDGQGPTQCDPVDRRTRS